MKRLILLDVFVLGLTGSTALLLEASSKSDSMRRKSETSSSISACSLSSHEVHNLKTPPRQSSAGHRSRTSGSISTCSLSSHEAHNLKISPRPSSRRHRNRTGSSTSVHTASNCGVQQDAQIFPSCPGWNADCNDEFGRRMMERFVHMQEDHERKMIGLCEATRSEVETLKSKVSHLKQSLIDSNKENEKLREEMAKMREQQKEEINRYEERIRRLEDMRQIEIRKANAMEASNRDAQIREAEKNKRRAELCQKLDTLTARRNDLIWRFVEEHSKPKCPPLDSCAAVWPGYNRNLKEFERMQEAAREEIRELDLAIKNIQAALTAFGWTF